MSKVFDHIGIAVHEIDSALSQLSVLFGKPDKVEKSSLIDQDLKVAFVNLGGLKVELLEPLSPDSPISKFLEKRGPGIHHLAWMVDDIELEFNSCREKGLRLLSSEPYKGARNKRVFFIHPKDTSGVLVEYCASK